MDQLAHPGPSDFFKEIPRILIPREINNESLSQNLIHTEKPPEPAVLAVVTVIP